MFSGVDMINSITSKLAVIVILALLPGFAMAEREDWYFSFAFGLADHKHSGEFNDFFETADDFPGVDRYEFAMDILGFHWPVEGQNTTVGFVINSSSDTLTDDFDNDLSLYTYLYGVSGHHYFGNEIGDGFFVRGDVGFSRAVLSIDGFGDSSESGTGFLLGGGFALPVSGQSRIIFAINISDRKIDGDSFKSTQLTVGGLW